MNHHYDASLVDDIYLQRSPRPPQVCATGLDVAAEVVRQLKGCPYFDVPASSSAAITRRSTCTRRSTRTRTAYSYRWGEHRQGRVSSPVRVDAARPLPGRAAIKRRVQRVVCAVVGRRVHVEPKD